MTSPRPDSLYVHIPFCRRICPYCDFPKVLYRPEWSRSYLDALEKELVTRACGLFSTLYVGGGTPSCLSEEELKRLLSMLSPHLKPGGEFSIEANPDSLDEKKARLLALYGVSRVSLGAQSSTPKSLKTLGRCHDFEAVRKAVDLLIQAGIYNINVDWMYGFEGQSEVDVQADIEAFLSLQVTHFSCYSLILEPGTMFAVSGKKPLEDDAQQHYFELIRDALKQKGYARYEISNFALPGYECAHNLTYWKDLPYVGVGLGAAGYIGRSRYKNTRNLSSYLSGNYEGEREELTLESELEDFFLTNLRLVDGFSLDAFKQRFGFALESRYGEQIRKLQERGLIDMDEKTFKATARGLDLLDLILLELF